MKENGEEKTRKGHLVMVPYPAQGHINPMMQLANLLHSTGNFEITFVNTEFNHRRFLRSKGPEFMAGFPGFVFKTIPDGLPISDRDATQDIPSLCHSIRTNCLAPFKDLIESLASPVTCVVSDALTSFACKAAGQLGIPYVQFWTSSPCSFIGCMMFKTLQDIGLIPFKDDSFMRDGTMDMMVECPGMPNMCFKDLPSFIRTQSADEIMFDFIGTEARNCLNSPAIIFNTFTELDRPVLDAISTHYNFKNPKFPIGPLPLLASSPAGFSLWKEDTTCLEWLDQREAHKESVVYVNYGSITTMTEDDLIEFAWGLANSGQCFLWIVRPDVVAGSESTALPPEFLEATKGRGMVTTWCPQKEVLAHPAVVLFLTHCGWNSTMESVSCGVPIMCWPFFGDQPTTRRMACTAWGIGVEVDEVVRRDRLAAQLNSLMDGDTGRKLKDKANYWKIKALEATSIGGSSYDQFRGLVDHLLNPDH